MLTFSGVEVIPYAGEWRIDAVRNYLLDLHNPTLTKV